MELEITILQQKWYYTHPHCLRLLGLHGILLWLHEVFFSARRWIDNNLCKSQKISAFALVDVSESQKQKQAETIQYQSYARANTPISLKKKRKPPQLNL